MLLPTCYIWGWTATIDRLDRFWSVCDCGSGVGKVKGLLTVLVRVISELIIPFVVILLMAPTTFGARFGTVCK